MHKWRSFRTSKFTLIYATRAEIFLSPKHTKIQFLEKIKWNSKIYPLGMMKTPLLYHLKPTWWQSMHKWRSFRTSKCYQGWNFSKYTRAIRSNFWKKIKWNSKIYPLGIMKTPLLYHLKQTSWQSMHKWNSFRTCKFTPKVSGLKYF